MLALCLQLTFSIETHIDHKSRPSITFYIFFPSLGNRENITSLHHSVPCQPAVWGQHTQLNLRGLRLHIHQTLEEGRHRAERGRKHGAPWARQRPVVSQGEHVVRGKLLLRGWKPSGHRGSQLRLEDSAWVASCRAKNNVPISGDLNEAYFRGTVYLESKPTGQLLQGSKWDRNTQLRRVQALIESQDTEGIKEQERASAAAYFTATCIDLQIHSTKAQFKNESSYVFYNFACLHSVFLNLKFYKSKQQQLDIHLHSGTFNTISGFFL